MSTSLFITLIAAAWLSYPFFGAASISAAKAQGKADEDAGFSFLPEVIVYPPIFFGVGYAIDQVAMPVGRWIISGICVLMLAVGLFGFARNIAILRRSQNSR